MLNLDKYNNILVIRFDGIGDIVIGSPVYRELSKVFTKNIYAVVKPEKYKVMKYCPYIKETFMFDCKIMDSDFL